MGTLDDAIREHLELKKRSGAADEDIKRLESEAFGPIRREPVEPAGEAAAAAPGPETDAGLPDEDFAPEAPEFDPEPVAAAEPEAAPVREPPADEPLLHDTVAPPAVEPDPEAVVPPPAAPPAEPPRRAEREPEKPWLEDDEFDDGPQPTAEFSAAEVAEAAGDAAPEDYVAPDEEGEGEDLLEETPDFLQETPEHDRLWFEQRPPRDFDFDQ
jgi:hypothetical protein